MEELAMHCLEAISKHPRLAKDINDLFVLCEANTEKEIDLCKKAIDELIK